MFSSQVRVVNEELYRKTLEEIVRSLDKMENANIPSVSLSKREVGKTQTLASGFGELAQLVGPEFKPQNPCWGGGGRWTLCVGCGGMAFIPRIREAEEGGSLNSG